MRHQARSLIGCAALVIALAAAWRAFGASTSEPMVVFGVIYSAGFERGVESAPVIEPIVMVERTRRADGTYRVAYSAPPRGVTEFEVADKATLMFGDRYLQRGRALTVVNGGAAIGYLRVKQRRQTNCLSMDGVVDLYLREELVQVPDPTALAVGSLPARPGKATRRYFTDREYDDATGFARRVLARKGVSAAQLRNLELYVAAFDLQRDGTPDYAATVLTCARAQCEELFLVM